MAVERSQEHILGRALAVVPIPVSAIAHPSSRPTPTDGLALTVVLIDAATGLPYVAGGGAVTIADGADVAEGATADAAWDGISLSATVISLLKPVALAALSTLPGSVVGGTAADAALGSQEPVTIGGLAKTASPTAVADGDAVNALFDKFGRSISRGALRELMATVTTTITSSTAETTIVAAVASTFNDIYRIQITNTSASQTTVTIRDGTAGTTRWVYVLNAGDTKGFSAPVDSFTKQTAVNTNWTAQCSASVAGVVIAVDYVQNS